MPLRTKRGPSNSICISSVTDLRYKITTSLYIMRLESCASKIFLSDGKETVPLVFVLFKAEAS